MSFASDLDFAKDIQPLLNSHCAACHNQPQAKADLRLESYSDVMKGGKSGAVLVKGKSDQSPLYLLASGKEDPVMPPRKNKVGATPLSDSELNVIKRWIDQGAPGTDTIVSAPVHWRPLPASFMPINAVGLTADAQYAACGRANQVFIYQLPANAFAGRLIDGSLAKEGVDGADRDFILSLAFSPDGTLLASGGYRNIKLWRRTAFTPLLTLESEPNSTAVASSPDGKWLATCAAQNHIKIWDAASGAVAHELSGHTGTIRALQFSPDSTSLCSASADKTLRVWSVSGNETGKTQSPADVNAVAWLGDGKRIAAACADNLIRVWTLPDSGADWGTPKELKGHSGAVTALCSVPPKQILSGSADGSVRLWDCDAGNELKKMDHGGPVGAVAAQSEGKYFASAGGNAARLWKADGQPKTTFKGDRHAYEAQADCERNLAFEKEQVAYFKTTVQENEKTLATETENAKKTAEKAKAALTESAQKQEAAKKAADAKGELDKQFGEPLAAVKKASDAKDAAEKATAAVAQELKPFNDKVEKAKAAVAKANEAKAVADKALAEQGPKAKKEEGQQLKSKAEAAAAALNQATTAQKAAEDAAAPAVAKAKAAEDARNAAQKTFSELFEKNKDADGKMKAAEKAITEASTALKQAEQSKSAAEQNHERCDNVQKRVQDALNAAKESLAKSEADQKRAETALEAAKKAATDSEKALRAIAFSPDNRLLVAAGEDRIIHTWGIDTGREGEQYIGQADAIVALSYLPDGRLLSQGTGAKTLLWNKNTEWKLERTIGTGNEKSPIMDRVLALEFSPNGKLLASGGGVPARTGELKLWNVADGTLAREIKDPHTDTVFSIDFSRDGSVLASGAADRNVKLFDVATGKFIRLFEGHTNHVLSVSWKRDGRTLVTGGADKVAKVWDLVTGEQKKSVDGFKHEVTAVCYLDPQNEFVIASGDGQLRTSKEDGNKPRNFPAGGAYIQSAAATPDGKIIVAGGSDSVLRVFEANKDKVLQSFEAPKEVAKTDKK